MGNCGSDDIRYAISQDGQENVKKAAILTASQNFIENFVQQKKPLYEQQLNKRFQLKEEQIAETKKLIDKKLQQKKIELETQETGTLEYLTSKHNQSFQILSGYADAVAKLQEFHNRAKQVYAAQNQKIFKDIDKYKDDLKFQLEKLKQPLPALMAFGLKQKEKILTEVAKQHPKQVDEANSRMKEQLRSQFAFQETHRKRCEEWAPKSELDAIVESFQKSLSNLHTKKFKSGSFGCF